MANQAKADEKQQGRRVLAIGVGGSGKSVLTILKERLQETYGKVPANVVLLSIDTDELREVDTFAGTRLNQKTGEDGREVEYVQVTSRPGVTMNSIFTNLADNRTTSYMGWVERQKLDKNLSPTERDIRGGAQQRRPIGRVAIFERWNTIRMAIRNAIIRIYGEPDNQPPMDDKQKELSKRLIFIVGSVAGGTGSGMLIDVANLVRDVITEDRQRFQSVDMAGVIVLPDAFSSQVNEANDTTNLKPNSYAALRELDRFIRAHSGVLPYTIRYDEELTSTTLSTAQLFDHVYLVDTNSPNGVGDSDLTGDPTTGVFPLISDFIMAHVDKSLSTTMGTSRSNAGPIAYKKSLGRSYSGFNILSYIFPAEDVIESFSYRFLHDLMVNHYLPTTNLKTLATMKANATKEVENIFAVEKINGRVIPGVVQKAITCTRPVDSDVPDVSWDGLFNLISLSDEGFSSDLDQLHQLFNTLAANMLPSTTGPYRGENYGVGNRRLMAFARNFMERVLGPSLSSNDEDARADGEWDKILEKYGGAISSRFASAVDEAILGVLNRRDPNSDMLLPERLPFAMNLLKALKARLIQFKDVLETEIKQLQLSQSLLDENDAVKKAIAKMMTDADKTFAWLGKSKAQVAQEDYISHFRAKMQILLHQKIYETVVKVLNTLGALPKDEDENRSVLDEAQLELENWLATFQTVDSLLIDGLRVHESHRREKTKIRVRRYLTNPEFEDSLYLRPEVSVQVANRVLGKFQNGFGLEWKRRDDMPLAYRLVSLWSDQATGAEKIVEEFFKGTKELFLGVRELVTVADRIADQIRNASSLAHVVAQINQPFLRFNPTRNITHPIAEHYFSYTLQKSSDKARELLEGTRDTMRHQGYSIDNEAESTVACTVVEISRGYRLEAVEQFAGCDERYRLRILDDQESLHLFKEEQLAVKYESWISILKETDNRQRVLSPELVIAMSDENMLKAFVMACVYRIIDVDPSYKDINGKPSTEVTMKLPTSDPKVFIEKVLSQSEQIRQVDSAFATLPADGKNSRLYLNALQNFMLFVIERDGVPPEIVDQLIKKFKDQNVPLDHIKLPFSISEKVMQDGISLAAEGLGPFPKDDPDERTWRFENSQQQIKKIDRFLDLEVKRFKATSDYPAVKDMGTLMHLILHEEKQRLQVNL